MTGERSEGTFDTLERALANPAACRTLELDGDEFRPPDLALPESIAALENLEVLQLDLYNSVTVPPIFGKLTKLHRVVIEGVGTTFPVALLDAPNLQHLELMLTGGVVPDEIQRAKRLRTLALSGLQTVSPAIGRLRHLRSLSLSGRELRWLPDEIGALASLRELDVSYSALRTVPKPVTRLVDLERLNIGMTFIDELPLEIANLKKLAALRFAKPFEHHGPEQYRTRVKQIRQCWCELTALETLDLSHQNILDASGHVRRLTNLAVIDLSYNEMDEIPEELFGLPGVRVLNLDFNRLAALAPDFARFTKLESLSLIANPLTDHEPLLAMKRLRALDLRRVPFEAAQFAEIERALPECRVTYHQPE